MQFLKTLFWVIVIVGLTIFAINNWVPVTINLWGGMVMDTKLPMLVIISFIVGFFPLWLWHRMTHWRMKRRIVSLEGGSTGRQPLNMGNESTQTTFGGGI
jgi:lipopolysaccharide assembly protein A